VDKQYRSCGPVRFNVQYADGNRRITMWWKSTTFTFHELRVISFLFSVLIEEAPMVLEDYFILEIIRLSRVEKFDKVLEVLSNVWKEESRLLKEYSERGPFFKKVQTALYLDNRRN